MNSGDLIYSAVQHLQSGRLKEAEANLGMVLGQDPASFDALHILSIVKISQANYSEAKHLLERALKIRPNELSVAINLGKICLELGLLNEAEAVYTKAIKSNPKNPDILFGLGIVFQNLGKFDNALDAYANILKLYPDFLEARINLAAMLSDGGNYFDALELLGAAPNKDIGDSRYWSNLASTHLGLKNWVKAQDNILRALAINSNDPSLHIKHGEILLGIGQSTEGVKAFQVAIEIAPEMADAWIGLGNAYSELDLAGDATFCFDRALKINTNSPGAWCSKGILLKNEGKNDEALRCFMTASQIDPNLPEAKYNASHIQLQAGNFPLGWANYEYRWRVNAFTSSYRLIDRPLWSGDPLKGRLLIWCEQGIGDQILYASILSLVLQRISDLLVVVDERLLPILRRSFPNIEFISDFSAIEIANIEAHIPLGSLGKYFLSSWQDFSLRKMPYLFANTEQSGKIRNEVIGSDKLVCGLSWSSKAMKHAKDKSFDLSKLLPLLDSKKRCFIDVGYVDSFLERTLMLKEHSIEVKKIDAIDSFSDIDGLASVIDACDLIITCSNTCAHLAGALGKVVYLLAPQSRGRLWYWQDVNGMSLWYPSVRILEKKDGEDWDAPINALRRILED